MLAAHFVPSISGLGIAMANKDATTRWGGVADGRVRPSRYFRIARQDRIFWLVDPDGGRFLSKGINSVTFEQDRIQKSDRIPYVEACNRKYRSLNAWRESTIGRISQWGFNTLGAWSDETLATGSPLRFAVTPILDLGMSYAWRRNEQNKRSKQEFPDVFERAFEYYVRSHARDLCEAMSNDSTILGWFIDNELRWGSDWRGVDELLTLFLNLEPHSAGRKAALGWLRKRYPDFAEFNSVWRTPAQSWDALERLNRLHAPYRRQPIYQQSDADHSPSLADPGFAAFAADCDAFAALVAKRYFELTAAAIKAADPNHLILGCRFAYKPSPGVIGAGGRYCDVISFNCYDPDPSGVIDAYAAAERPCLIGEFSFRGIDSGLPNTKGAGPLVATQAERATGFRHYVTAALRHPAVVGYHWFEYADQPAAGRFDGENSNFGTVTIEDEVYEELTQAMASVNVEAEDLHATAEHAFP
jgi:agarase